MGQLTDDIWQVICDHLLKYKGIVGNDDIKRYIEDNMEIIPFDGGVLVVKENEFDVFVVPEKRGKWRIRSTGEAFFKRNGNPSFARLYRSRFKIPDS